jgi:hypothetical protein
MNRRNFLKTSAALTVCSTVLNTEARARSLLATDPANTWDRPIHIVYAQSGGPSLAETDDVLLNAWDQVPGGITAMTPFLLNVKNPSKYASMINEVQARGITITPGIGQDPSNGPINQPNYKAMAAAYRQYTDYVRLENMQGFYDTYGRAPIQDMIDYCTATLGFTRIMLNPWPKASSGALVPFTNPELDSSFNNVMLDFNRQTFEVNPNPNDWLVNQTYVGLIQAYKPSINVVVNYESAPQHEALLQLEKDNPGSSIPALNITATQCETSPNNLHWCPPFTQIYDPIALGTWPWIANRLGDMPGSVNLQIAMALTRTSTGYEETLTVTNNGTATAADVLVNTATVGSTAGATLPVLLGDLQPNQAASVTLDFPDSAGAPNTRTTGQIAGTYNGGTFGGTLRMILPS